MPSLATTADLATYLHRTFAVGAEVAEAQIALDLASSAVRVRTGQNFDMVVGDVLTLETDGEDVFLPQRPVTAVTAVTTRDRGSVLLTTRVVNVDYEVLRDRLRWVSVGVWPYEVSVTYSHGYVTIPDDVRAATLALAAEIHGNPDGLSSETIDDYTWRRQEGASVSLAERLLAAAERRHGRRVLSVKIT